MDKITELADLICQYFKVGGECYTYILTRVRSAFGLGTVTINDFVEFDEDEAEDMAAYLLQNEANISNSGCHFCENAVTNPELSHDEDLSYTTIGDCENQIRILYRTGDKRPTELLVERWNEHHGWGGIGRYRPKFCPECGRKLIENEEKE